MVVAETPAAARDGAERVVVDWTPLPAGDGAPGRRRTRPRRSSTTDTTSNVCVDCDSPATPRPWRRRSRGAAHVVRLRHVGASRHRRADGAARGGRRLGRGERPLHRLRRRGRPGADCATGVAGVLGVPESAVRVVARDVGGNFGTRNSCYPEFALVAWAARRARPAGEVDGHAARGIPGGLPGSRPGLARRAGARRGRDVPGLPRRQHQQHRRPRRLVPSR